MRGLGRGQWVLRKEGEGHLKGRQGHSCGLTLPAKARLKRHTYSHTQAHACAYTHACTCLPRLGVLGSLLESPTSTPPALAQLTQVKADAFVSGG